MSQTTETDRAYRCVCGRDVTLPFDHACVCGRTVSREQQFQVMPCEGGPLDGQRVTIAEGQHIRETGEVPAAWAPWYDDAWARWSARAR